MPLRVTVTIAMALAGTATPTSAQLAGQTVASAVAGPLSGGAAALGVEQQPGVEAAVAERNAARPDRRRWGAARSAGRSSASSACSRRPGTRVPPCRGTGPGRGAPLPVPVISSPGRWAGRGSWRSSSRRSKIPHHQNGLDKLPHSGQRNGCLTLVSRIDGPSATASRLLEDQYLYRSNVRNRSGESPSRSGLNCGASDLPARPWRS
jgi:hypothetical protein